MKDEEICNNKNCECQKTSNCILLSVCLIVRNEEEVLARCLTSIAGLWDELIIVDTGSTDKTKEIARAFGANISELVWCDDFASARNTAFARASGQYLLWMDADDVLPATSKKELLHLKARNFEGANQIALPYALANVDAAGTMFYRERIFKRSNNPTFKGFLHECVPWEQGIILLPYPIAHVPLHTPNSSRNLKILRRRLDDTLLDARMQYYYARELKDNGYANLALKEFYSSLRQGYLSNTDSRQVCLEIANLEAKLGHVQEQLSILTKGLLNGGSSDLFCELGRYFMERSLWKEAIPFYESAITATQDVMAFVSKDNTDFVPNLMLCVCYDRIGNVSKAREHNVIAAKIHPNHSSVIQNEHYFRTLQTISE